MMPRSAGGCLKPPERMASRDHARRSDNFTICFESLYTSTVRLEEMSWIEGGWNEVNSMPVHQILGSVWIVRFGQATWKKSRVLSVFGGHWVRSTGRSLILSRAPGCPWN